MIESFFRKIKTFQEKPEPVRRKIHIVATMIAFVLVVLLWLLMLGISENRLKAPDAGDSPGEAIGSIFREIKEELSATTEAIGVHYDVIKEEAQATGATSTFSGLLEDIREEAMKEATTTGE